MKNSIGNKKLAAILIVSILLFPILVTISPTFFSKSVARRTVVDKPINLEKVLDTNKSVELIFFGYVGCQYICTPRLEAIASWYERYEKKDALQVRFINLSALEDTSLANSFAQAFHSSFIGTYLPPHELREYTKNFEVYFAKSLFDEGEMDHSTNLYLLQRNSNEKILKYVYTAYPFDFKMIAQDIKELVNE